ncbi:cell wall protein DAN4-like [Lucilia sericata]|uniref:cell wall protein DAN4-like n=1 Tax=Lucilia sericata TaxID=13632 RepID=UPI0018A83B08|nr:cell wall protein DAN4-like [Lucilia sericata]
MFTLENDKNSKRRRNRIQSSERNDLSATEAILVTSTAALEKVATTLSLSQIATATTTKTLSIPQNNNRHHTTATTATTSTNPMKSIKNLSMSCKIFPSTSLSSSSSSLLSSLWSLSSCSSSIISGKIISRNLWRTTSKTPTLDTQSITPTTTATINTTSLWPHAASITRRRNNCGDAAADDYCDDCGGDRRCQSLRRHSHRRHFLLTLMLLLVVCIVNTSSVKAADSLTGILQSCANEGEEVQIAIKNSKCFKCACEVCDNNFKMFLRK